MWLTLITFLIVFSVIILVHELGHFWIARKAGIKVEEFGFGFPPRLTGKKIGKTFFSLNWLPFGGFVRLFGEELVKDYKKKGKDYKEAFWYKSKRARIAVLVAGVLANFLLAIVCFSIVYSISGIPTQTDRVNIVAVLPDSPAAELDLKENDIVLSVDEVKVNDLNHFVDLIDQRKGKEVKLLLERKKDNPCLEGILDDEQKFSCQDSNLLLGIEPRENPPEGEGSLGVLVSNVEVKKYPLWQMPFRGTVEGFKVAFALVGLIVSGLGKMLLNLVAHGQVPTEVAGPVGIMQMTGMVAKSGIIAVLQFTGLISVNLAIINVLPFPALDGGRLVFILYEAVTKKRPKPSFESWTNALGMAFLIALLVLVTINDIKRLMVTTNILQKIRAILPF